MEAIMALALVIISLAAGLADLTTPAYFETSPPTVETPPLAPLETFHSTAHIPISFPVSKLDPIMPRQATPALEPLQALQSTARIPISFPVDRFASDLPRASTRFWNRCRRDARPYSCRYPFPSRASNGNSKESSHRLKAFREARNGYSEAFTMTWQLNARPSRSVVLTSDSSRRPRHRLPDRWVGGYSRERSTLPLRYR